MADQEGSRLGAAGPPPGGPAAPAQNADSGPQAGGKSIQVDFAEARQALKHLETAYDELDAAYRQALNLTTIKNPGREQPSLGFAGAANPIGQAKLAEISNQQDLIRAMHANLKAQLESQERTEEANAQDQRDIRG